jgi:hypothetical protein
MALFAHSGCRLFTTRFWLLVAGYSLLAEIGSIDAVCQPPETRSQKLLLCNAQYLFHGGQAI